MTIKKPNWRLSIFSVGFFALFLSLGVWQIERGYAKTEILEGALAKANLAGEFLVPDLIVTNGDPVRSAGQFQSDFLILIDNRVLNGRVGYEVIQLFTAENGTSVLVNRGFIGGGLTRDQLPDLQMANTARQPIRGHAYLTELPVPEQNIAGDVSPWVVQVVKPAELEGLTGLSDVFPHVIRLEEAHPDALPRHWPVTVMSPERHFGYAVQWFLMAMAVVIAFVFSMRKQNNAAEG